MIRSSLSCSDSGPLTGGGDLSTSWTTSSEGSMNDDKFKRSRMTSVAFIMSQYVLLSSCDLTRSTDSYTTRKISSFVADRNLSRFRMTSFGREGCATE